MTLQKSTQAGFGAALVAFIFFDYIPDSLMWIIVILVALYMLISTVWFHVSKRHQTNKMSKTVFVIGVASVFGGLGYFLSPVFIQYEGFEAIGVFIYGTIAIIAGLVVMSLSAFFKLKVI